MLDIPILRFTEGAVLKDMTGKSGDAPRRPKATPEGR
jgi:hypothetical protein